MEWLSNVALAAWLQAGASFLAIMASASLAIWIPRRDRKRRIKELAVISHILMETTAKLLENSESCFSSRGAVDEVFGGERPYDSNALDEAQRQLDQIPLFELGNARVAIQVMMTQDHLRTFRQNANLALSKYRKMNAKDFDNLANLVRAAVSGARHAEQTVGASLKQL